VAYEEAPLHDVTLELVSKLAVVAEESHKVQVPLIIIKNINKLY
jgi:hypothetical protein